MDLFFRGYESWQRAISNCQLCWELLKKCDEIIDEDAEIVVRRELTSFEMIAVRTVLGYTMSCV